MLPQGYPTYGYAPQPPQYAYGQDPQAPYVPGYGGNTGFGDQSMVPAYVPGAYQSVPRNKKSNSGLIVGLIIGVILIGGIAASLVVVRKQTASTQNPRTVETSEQKYAEARQAFAGPSAVPDSNDEGAIKKAMEVFTRASARSDAQAMAACFDFDRMVTEVAAASGPKVAALMRERGARSGMVRGMENGLKPQLLQAFQWMRSEVKHVRFLPNRLEAVVYIRARTADGFEKGRFWVCKTGQGWRIFDFEDLSTGIRGSTMMSAAMGPAMDDPSLLPVFKRASVAVQQARAQIDAGEFEQAITTLQGITDRRLPSSFEVIRLVLLGTATLSLERYDDALNHTSRAISLQADLPVALLLKSRALIATGKHADALQMAERYEAAIGLDDVSASLRGEALMKLDRRDDAVAAVRAGLAEFPGDSDLLSLLAIMAKSKSDRAELQRQLAASDEKSAALLAAISVSMADKDLEQVEVLLGMYRNTIPTFANSAEYQWQVGQLHVHRKEWKQARDVYRAHEQLLRNSPYSKDAYADEIQAIEQALAAPRS
jgi:tetratricopeptide (TPR) repeat protein